MNEITKTSFADDVDANQALTLVEPDTKAQAHLMALQAIATPVTLERRDILVGRARAITVITTEKQLKDAGECAGLLKTLRNDVEESRKLIKNKVLVIGRAIDGTADATISEALKEMNRLQQLQSAYIAEQERLRQVEIRRREQEAQRLREEQERVIREAAKKEEEARKEAEEASKAGKSLVEQLEAEEQAEQAAQAAQVAVAQAAPVYVAPVAEVAPIRGAAVSTGWDFEVTDITALYAHKPECVELVEKRQVIKAIVASAAQQAGGKEFSIPGLRIFPKTTVINRSR